MKLFFVTPLGPRRLFNSTFIDNSSLHLYSDASSFGFGAIFDSHWLWSKWSPLFSSKISSNVITFLEFFPIYVALLTWGSLLHGKKIVFHCDNAALVDILNKLTSNDADILKLLRIFVVLCVKSDIEIRAIHIPGCNNQICDSLSRGEFKKNFIFYFLLLTLYLLLFL